MAEKFDSRQERKQADKRKEQKNKNPLKMILMACLVLLVLSVGAGSVVCAAMVKDAPPIDPAKLANPLPAKFFDKNGKLIYEYGEQIRTDITYSQLPKQLENAYIATEDANFYQHGGVDIRHTIEAAFANITGGFGSEGGSTITQQLVKNTLLTSQKTIKRKVQEWYLADEMEKKFSKQQILTMYLNKIYLGNGAYGVAAAAQNYYGVDADHLSQLTLPEVAMLAGLPQGPSRYDPTQSGNVKAATERRNTVLDRMYKQGYITKQQMQDAMNVPVTKGLVSQTKHSMPYQSFLTAAAKEVESKLPNLDLGTSGLSIYTTLDPKAQEYADKMMNTNQVIVYPNSRFQGAFVFLDTHTGEVRAIGSGRNQYQTTFMGNNLAISLQRQPGSTFKPIFDYGPAIENLKWSTGHQLDDVPTTYSNGQPIQNWDHASHGWLSIRTALQESYNIPALLTLRSVGLDRAQNFAEKLGITFPQNQVYESYAIGSNLVNPLEMAGAYSAFGNSGIYNQPTFVDKVVYPDGESVNFTPQSKQVMHEYTAYLMTDMMRSVVHSGTGMTANVPWLDVAGKTGTTNFDANTMARYGYPYGATNDSWFVGFTPQYTMAVWTGYPGNGPGNYLDESETKIAQLMFKDMMENFGTDTTKFTKPDDVYQTGNEWYVDGGESAVVPKTPQISQGDSTGSGSGNSNAKTNVNDSVNTDQNDNSNANNNTNQEDNSNTNVNTTNGSGTTNSNGNVPGNTNPSTNSTVPANPTPAPTTTPAPAQNQNLNPNPNTNKPGN